MRIKIQKAIVFNKIHSTDWASPIFSIIALVPDRLAQKSFYMFLAGNMKKFSFSIKKFPEGGGLYLSDLMDMGLIKEIHPHTYVYASNIDKAIERIKSGKR